MIATELEKNAQIFTVPDALTAEQCSQLIELFEMHPEDQQAGVAGTNGGMVKPDVKQSTDTMIRQQPHWQDADAMLFNSLVAGLEALKKEVYYFSNADFGDAGYQIQRTNPGQFYRWHIDTDMYMRDRRVLSVLWYLNTLEEGQGGRTRFLNQDLAITPEAGTLVFFPPYHTHTHQGEALKYGQKYIAITWMILPE